MGRSVSPQVPEGTQLGKNGLELVPAGADCRYRGRLEIRAEFKNGMDLVPEWYGFNMGMGELMVQGRGRKIKRHWGRNWNVIIHFEGRKVIL